MRFKVVKTPFILLNLGELDSSRSQLVLLGSKEDALKIVGQQQKSLGSAVKMCNPS